MPDPNARLVYCTVCGEYYYVGEHHSCHLPPSEMDEDETIDDDDGDNEMY